MAIRTLTYLDLTPEQRHDAAAKLRAVLRQQLASLEAESEAYRLTMGRLEQINQWEKGLIKVTP